MVEIYDFWSDHIIQFYLTMYLFGDFSNLRMYRVILSKYYLHSQNT